MARTSKNTSKKTEVKEVNSYLKALESDFLLNVEVKLFFELELIVFNLKSIFL